jgi:hypothetical protein
VVVGQLGARYNQFNLQTASTDDRSTTPELEKTKSTRCTTLQSCIDPSIPNTIARIANHLPLPTFNSLTMTRYRNRGEHTAARAQSVSSSEPTYESDTGSSTSDDHGDEFATTESLVNAVGDKLMTFKTLPELEKLYFYKQDEEQYQPICLHLGHYGDGTGTVSSLYVYLKYSTNHSNAPGMHLIKALSTTTVLKSHVKAGDANTGTHIDFTELVSMIERGIIHLNWPFRALDTRLRDMIAVIKYCFVLAAQSRLHDYKDHCIPQVASFDKDLRSACMRIQKHMDDNPKLFAETGHHDNKVRNAQEYNHVPERETYNSDGAAIHVENTGITELNQLPPGLLQQVEGLDKSSPPAAEPTSHRPEASKRSQKQLRRQDRKRRKAKAHKKLTARTVQDYANRREAALPAAAEHTNSDSSSTEDKPKQKKVKRSKSSSISAKRPRPRPNTSHQVHSPSVRRTRPPHIKRTKSTLPEVPAAYRLC